MSGRSLDIALSASLIVAAVPMQRSGIAAHAISREIPSRTARWSSTTRTPTGASVSASMAGDVGEGDVGCP